MSAKGSVRARAMEQKQKVILIGIGIIVIATIALLASSFKRLSSTEGEMTCTNH